ncbi:type VI secretion system baseplate subunit TssF, partial [Candidatus Poribacteria bacterium]|nr:type VI secretion system baseplate subunit TssF [Candidatus Poribacteria bacterium]
ASQPIRDIGMNPCRFTTCYDVHVRPIKLIEGVLDNLSILKLRFEIEKGVDYRNLFHIDSDKEYDIYSRRAIRICIHDVDQITGSFLILYLNRYVQEISIKATPGNSEVKIQDQAGIQFVGLASEEALLPYTRMSFSGYRILQEYFSYPRKFQFFDIFGFDRLNPSAQLKEFEVSIRFNKKLPENVRINTNNLRLHCTPIINLSKGEAKPIRINHEATEYKVEAPTEGAEIFSVDTATGVVTSSLERKNYVNFFSFKHGIPGDTGKDQPDGYYHVNTRLSFGEEKSSATYISIVNTKNKADFQEETLSLGISYTNGIWARNLNPGDIINPTPDTPEFVKFRNLIQPSLILYPPLETGLEWRFISNLSLNYLSLRDADSFRTIMGFYNWSVERGQRDANINRIDSIANIRAEPQEIPYRGSVITGMKVTLEIDRKKFTDDGDIFLFGNIIREFLNLYITINSFVQLSLIAHDTKEEIFSWELDLMKQRNMESLSGRRRFLL